MPYLKGNIQDRITDLREQNGWSKAELAERIGIDASRMGRIESGETKSVGDDVILALAKAFGVSTDFLLGVSDDPEPNNYDIKDLGLSIEAAKNLYTEKIDPDVLNLMMEDPRFGTLTYMISRYLHDVMTEGYRAQSKLYNMAATMITGMNQPGAQPAAEEILSYRPDVQTELALIENGFAAILKDIKKKICGKMAESRSEVLTKSVFVQIKNELQKGIGKKSLQMITASQMADAVVTVMSDFDGVTPEMQRNLKAALIPYFTKPLKRKMDDKRGTLR